jgi:hypothetical protein
MGVNQSAKANIRRQAFASAADSNIATPPCVARHVARKKQLARRRRWLDFPPSGASLHVLVLAKGSSSLLVPVLKL